MILDETALWSENCLSIQPRERLNMKTLLLFFFAVMSLAILPASIQAAVETTEPSPWTVEDTYMEQTIGKLSFGLTNLTVGWAALPFEISKNSNPFTGILKGIWRTTTNTVGGALHAASFPFPFDIPLPDGGVKFE